MVAVYEIDERDRAEIIKVLATLKDVVEGAGPDYIYPGSRLEDNCLYVINGSPSCIAARVLDRLGVSMDLLGDWEGNMVDNLPHYVCKLHRSARSVLGWAQRMQDDRVKPWGEILTVVIDRTRQLYGVEA